MARSPSRARRSVEPASNGFALHRNLAPTHMDPRTFSGLGRATRPHKTRKIRKVMDSLQRWGFVLPVLVDDKLRVIAGAALVRAAIALDLPHVPAVVISDLAEAELLALKTALNRLAEESDWDKKELSLEFRDIMKLDADFDFAATGFDFGEIEPLLQGDGSDEEDELPPVEHDKPAIAQPGDVRALGDHRIFCGDALKGESYRLLLGDERTAHVVSDPPFNVAIHGHASGLGAHRHREFAMASGEMSSSEFETFLQTAFGRAVAVSRDGALHLIFMDWRHLKELWSLQTLYSELKNVCVWVKANAGMGSLYRSQHELVAVLKVGKAPHVNNVDLGRYGRHRSNVWMYAGQTSLRGAKNKLVLHPTVKPVAMIADALRDCSNRGDVVLDLFAGVGTLAIAAEKTGRRARLIEIDPHFVDSVVRRWEILTGRKAVRIATANDPSASTAPVPALTSAASKKVRRSGASNAVATGAHVDASVAPAADDADRSSRPLPRNRARRETAA